MKRTWTVTLLQNQQPDPTVWREATRLVDAWSADHQPKFDPSLPFMRTALFDEAARPALDDLVARLDELKRTRGAVYLLGSRTVLDDGDFAKADFVGVMGAELDEEIVANEASALASRGPCPRCGWEDSFDAVQREPFAIDEAALDRGTSNGEGPGEGGWDLVNLPGGQLLVSRRVASLLEENGVRGYELREVNDAATGRPSTRAWQLRARRAVLTPCPEHSKVEGEPFCPVCGTAHGVLDGYFWVRSDWIGDDEVVARHPGLGSMLYLARRVYALLEAAGLNGLSRDDALFVCRHDG